jgi:uncharacterized protein YqjF (DUF2071 family)
MRPDALLARAAHRPWPLPTQRWAMRQTWRELLFAHWPLPPEHVRPYLPAGLILDTYEGQAWVSVVPFRMTDIRFRGAPPLPLLSTLPEINLRTYASAGGKPGVLFFSLDAGSALAVWGARTFFHLPYYTARFQIQREGEVVRYASTRTHQKAPAAVFRGSYRPTGPVYSAAPGSLDNWLTARYCLYTTDHQGRLLRGEIHHAPWPLQPAEAEIERETLSRAAGLALPNLPPLLHYAHRLDILAWSVRRI